MRVGVAAASLAVVGMVSGAVSWAEDASRFPPMQQFEVKPLSSPPAVDRSANSYARCAGFYLNAGRMDENNSFAREAEALLMAKALSVGGPGEAESLRILRDDESVQIGQRHELHQTTQRKLWEMEKAGQTAMTKKQEQELLLPMLLETVFVARCYRLVQELGKEGAKQ